AAPTRSTDQGVEVATNGGVAITIHGHDFITVSAGDPATQTLHYTSPIVTVGGTRAIVVGGAVDGSTVDIVVPPMPAAGFPTPQSNPPCKTGGTATRPGTAA